MGVVYRATQLALERPVAIKLIATERAAGPGVSRPLQGESRLAAAIEHANVIPVYEAGEDDGLLFIAMRLVDGTDLGAAAGTRRCARAGEGGARDRPARGGAGRRARPRPRAPRRQARQRAAHASMSRSTRTSPTSAWPSTSARGDTRDQGRPVGRHARLPGARADPRRGRSAQAPTSTRWPACCYHCLTGRSPFPRDNEPATLWAHVNADPSASARLRRASPEQIDAVDRARHGEGSRRALRLGLGPRARVRLRPWGR